MSRRRTALALSACLVAFGQHSLEGAPAQTVYEAGESCCARRARVTPLTTPGVFRIDTPHGTSVAHWPVPPKSTAAQGFFVVNAHDSVFDADGDTTTFIDTLRVPVNGHVRWILRSSIHTITNGRNSADPSTATLFNILVDVAHPTFDTTFTAPDTVDYFCFFHEPLMAGVVIVDPAFGSVGVPEDRPSPLRFLGPPSPNPSRGVVQFEVELDRPGEVEASVFDSRGRRVAIVEQGQIGAGLHRWTWDGRAGAGGPAAAGIYFIRVRALGFTSARPILRLP